MYENEERKRIIVFDKFCWVVHNSKYWTEIEASKTVGGFDRSCLQSPDLADANFNRYGVLFSGSDVAPEDNTTP